MLKAHRYAIIPLMPLALEGRSSLTRWNEPANSLAIESIQERKWRLAVHSQLRRTGIHKPLTSQDAEVESKEVSTVNNLEAEPQVR
jgi:hypothetical protein